MSTRRRLLFGLLTFLFVALVIELMAQLAYFATAGAFVFQRTSPPIFRPDPHRCYSLRPDLAYRHRTNEFELSVYTNPQGFRTDERRRPYPEEKPPGLARLLFLGPSFTFGWGSEYEDIYPTLAGRLLEERGLPVEVVNAGVPAQGIAEQLCWLREVGSRYDPDVVVQTVYGQSVPAMPTGCPESLECPVVQDGRVYSQAPTLGRRVVATAKKFATVFYGYYAYQALTSSWSGEGTGKELHQHTVDDDASTDELVRSFEGYVRFVKRSLGDDTQVVFVYFPLSYVVHPQDAARWAHLGDPNPARERQKIAAAAEALHASDVRFVDATPALIERAGSERLYYWLDIHFTPLGNRVVAEELAPALGPVVARVLVERTRAAKGRGPGGNAGPG